MPPSTMGSPGKAWRQRLEYTMVARLGRMSARPPGEYWSTERTFFWVEDGNFIRVGFEETLGRLEAVVLDDQRGFGLGHGQTGYAQSRSRKREPQRFARSEEQVHVAVPSSF